MSTPFLSEIKVVSFNFAPKGWAMCNGQLLPINQNQALFSLLGTTYGGDGRTTFGLPELRGKVAMHTGQSHVLGERGGEENHTLTQGETPAHTHVPLSDPAAGTVFNPLTHYPALAAPHQNYSALGNGELSVAMNPAMLTNTGGSQPHANMQPFLVLNFIIALQGIF